MFTCYLGLWLHESGVLAASPDRLVQKLPKLPQVHYQSELARYFSPQLIEVKCPYSSRDMTVLDAVLTNTGDCFLGK
jgi:hypothetical protein